MGVNDRVVLMPTLTTEQAAQFAAFAGSDDKEFLNAVAAQAIIRVGHVVRPREVRCDIVMLRDLRVSVRFSDSPPPRHIAFSLFTLTEDQLGEGTVMQVIKTWTTRYADIIMALDGQLLAVAQTDAHWKRLDLISAALVAGLYGTLANKTDVISR